MSLSEKELTPEPSRETRGQWIRTKDEVPNDGHVVIVESGVAYIENGVWYSVTAEPYPGTPIQWEVKYWMSFPPTPDEI